MLAATRAFFAARGVLEVETPLLSSAAATAPHLDSFRAHYTGPGAADGLALYLHTSPEFAMKRLLAADSGPIYQICKVFRNGERGRIHNPEFTMLEWYRPGFDQQALMDETEQLVTDLLGEAVLPEPSERLTYAEAFVRHAQINPLAAPMHELHNCVSTHGIEGVKGLAMDDRDGWLDLLLTHVVGPKLGPQRLCFLYDYPASQAALARIRPGTAGQPYPVAERFELYVNGIELASGYHELGDGIEQRHRFEADINKRVELCTVVVPMDERLLAALESGLPDCAGVAVGVDRLVMLATGAAVIDQVVSFPVIRA